MNADLGKFKTAYGKLVALINDESLTWEQKNAKLFLEPKLLLNELKETGLLQEFRYTPPASDRTEVLYVQQVCLTKIDYLQGIENS